MSLLPKNFNAQAALDFFRATVGQEQVLLDPKDLQVWGRDWTRFHEPDPFCIVLPKTTQEVSQVLKYCHDHRIPVVPSGGRTGLVAGAVAAQKEVVLSLARFNQIEAVDNIGFTITAQAGVTTQALQDAARDVGLFFPLDLAAKGSCHIGGNVATNAGGVKLIRYGGTREQVLGLEVVLADGQVMDLMSPLRKNNSGYDLKQLFVGSEGTLGIVTRAVFRLVAKPKALQVSVMGVETFQDITQILRLCGQRGVQVTAFEFFTQVAHQIVLQHQSKARSPFAEMKPFYVLLEIEKATGDELETLLEALFEEGVISDAVVGSTSEEHKALWGLRENITESIAAHGQVRKNDISLPIHLLNPFLTDLEKFLGTYRGDIEVVLFGHIGDGNLHLNYVGPFAMEKKKFLAESRDLEVKVFEILKKYSGSISAEHGIGLTKKQDLHFSRSALEVDLMRQIKKTFDPHGILNPGKIF